MLDLRRERRRTLATPSAGIIGGVVLGVVAAGLFAYYSASRQHTNRRLPFMTTKRHRVHLHGSINIDRSAEDIYAYWRDFSQLPKTMSFLERVEDRGAGITHWVAKGPFNTTLEWDSQVVDDLPNERISWNSLEGSDIRTWGDVQFRDNPRRRGTHVMVNFNFEPPGKIAGAAVGRFLSGLENAVLNQNLRNLKAYMETGEVPTNRLRRTTGEENARRSM